MGWVIALYPWVGSLLHTHGMGHCFNCPRLEGNEHLDSARDIIFQGHLPFQENYSKTCQLLDENIYFVEMNFRQTGQHCQSPNHTRILHSYSSAWYRLLTVHLVEPTNNYWGEPYTQHSSIRVSNPGTIYLQ